MKPTHVVLPNDIMLSEVRDLIKEGHEVSIATKGVSMLPFIEGKKDAVLLVPPLSLSPGDIVLGELSKGLFVLHRIVKIEEPFALLQGDGNWKGTERCRLDKIAGKVKEIRHPGGRVTDPACEWQMRRWRRWKAIPAIVRRYYLALYRRIKRISI